MSLAARCRRAREASGLTLGQAIRRTGIATLAQIESGASTQTDANLDVLADVYQVSRAWLAGGQPSPIDAATLAALRDANIRPADRDDILDLLAMMPTRGDAT